MEIILQPQVMAALITSIVSILVVSINIELIFKALVLYKNYNEREEIIKSSNKVVIFIVTICLFFFSTSTSVFANKVSYKGSDYAKIISETYEYDATNKVAYYIEEKILDTPKTAVSINVKGINKQMMVPIRQINTAFGLYTAFDPNLNTVLISEVEIKDIPKKNNTVAWSIPSMKLNPTSNINVPILCYHVISDGKADNLYTPYWKFEEHLKILKQYGYTAITPKQLYEAYYMKKSLPKNPILITFDDGYYDNYTRGYPLLKKYNMQGTIFIIGENIKETSNVSSVGGLDRLSWENIYAMKSHVTVQNHTYASHIKGISPKGKSIGVMATRLKVNNKWETNQEYWVRMGYDIRKMEDDIKSKIGYGSYIFSYPYGEFSYTTKQVLEQAKIPLAVTIKPGIASKNSTAYEVPRIIVNGNWSGNQLIKKINKHKK